MKWKVLITAPNLQQVLDKFLPFFDENNIKIQTPDVKEWLEEEELLQLIEDIDGVISGDDKFTKKVLNNAKKLKVISKWGTGIDSIDKEECNRLGIKVYNIPNAFSEPVADSVLGFTLCFARKIPWINDQMKMGIWEKIPGVSLNECALGIIGVGNVGKAVARRVKSFGMKLFGNDLLDMPGNFIKETEIKMVSKEELLSRVDFISINCDLNPTSFDLIGEKEFSIMKPNVVIINTARGPIINEDALIKALEEKKIAGAALDVFENEPLAHNSPLLKMGNVMLSPHNSNSSQQAWDNVHNSSIKNLLDGLRNSKR